VIDRDVMASAVEDKMIHVFLTLLHQTLVFSNFDLNYSAKPLIIYFVKMRLGGKIRGSRLSLNSISDSITVLTYSLQCTIVRTLTSCQSDG
jgi:hypothetical protein